MHGSVASSEVGGFLRRPTQRYRLEVDTRNRELVLLVASITIAPINLARQQQAPAGGEAASQRAAELKESLAANRAKLAKYQWMEVTSVLVKGDTKKTDQNLCQYAPDSSVQKTPVGPAPEPAKAARGLKGKIVAKKVAETKDYMEKLKSLVGEYVPPTRDKLQKASQAGNANSDASSSGVSSLAFANYLKPGDKVTFAFDSASKKIQTFSVNTYLDDPKTDIVTLVANFASLPDGSNYVAQTDLQAKSKNTEIKTTNSQYQLLHP